MDSLQHKAARQIPSLVMALDPGRDKCGIAIVTRAGKIENHRVVPVAQMRVAVEEWAQTWRFTHVVLGDSTASQEWRAKLSEWLPDIIIYLQDERGSTLEARPLYWQAHPPRGWRRLVPLSLQMPPEPIDDFAAVVLARRFFAQF